MIMQPEKFFRALADRTRLACLQLLLQERSLCVCELVHVLDLPQPRISRHLAQLRDQGIVLDERHGAWVYYRLHPDLPDWARQILELAGRADHDDTRTWRKRLKTMPNRPVACDQAISPTPEP
ncbi:MAG: ArsR family transcriptional regulator [Wenzhouxiangellaceae bacterium]|nr:MAG: ArsR family transcriptional regulator [Wenzhouxiangellaceae bacterium]